MTATAQLKCEMLVIQVDGTQKERSVTFRGLEPSSNELGDLIIPEIVSLGGSRTFERVRVLYDERYCDMFVDEIGQAKHLPINRAATEIYRTNWMKAYPETNPDDLPSIYGVAVLFDQPVWF